MQEHENENYDSVIDFETAFCNIQDERVPVLCLSDAPSSKNFYY